MRNTNTAKSRGPVPPEGKWILAVLTAWGVWLLLTGAAKDLADLARTLWADIRPALRAKGKAAR